ncbi:MAG: sulfatase-like hydrolase/transferase, partial [Gemmatimonadota bacterium]|nr:sulfatase-like hydrolase/transferase [Gemmatimonadota bacterium]
DAPMPPWLSVEAALIVGGMALLRRRRWSRALAWVLAGVVVLSTAALMADLVFRVSLGRPLNLSLDLYLLDAVYRLAVGNSGVLRTIIGVGALAVLGGSSLYATAWLLRPSSRDEDSLLVHLVPMAGTRVILGAVMLALLGLGGSVPVGSFLVDQVAAFRSTRLERVAFAADLERQPRAFADQPGLLEGLNGYNVVFVYIESYGTAALEDPEFAAVTRPRLEAAATRLQGAGLQLATGTLASPTLGGQSWYAHGTMLSGLWLENQLRYELLLASERETLVDDFRRAGYRTATMMPAITTAWPEAGRLGYDDVYTAQNIPYAGPPFYWVTMPDQFTWTFLGGVVRRATTPLFLEVGMLSSHAPWTPVLPLVDWDGVGDGAVFEPYRLDGYPPEEIWWDVAVLRDGYARSLSYSLQAMTGFAERFLDDRTLLVVLGDHQAAPWVTGASGPDVPVHVIARDASLLEPFLAWGFQSGAFPAPGSADHRMDDFRGWFVPAFSGPN